MSSPVTYDLLMARQPQITKVERDESGHWQARVTFHGHTTPVTRRSGSWTTVPDPQSGRCCEVGLSLAMRLQDRVRKAERAEKANGTQ